jgi:hypothetical protein
MRPLWLYRPLLNWRDVYTWAHGAGIKKMMPPDQLHATLATVRAPCRWDDLALQSDEIVVPAGHKAVQIFGYTIKALTFGHPQIKARHEELLARFPEIDHALLRPHVSLFRGGKMPRVGYDGELHFGPERAEEFNEIKGRDIKHVRVMDLLEIA